MKFTELSVKGCFEVELDLLGDDRGWFSRFYCSADFADAGIPMVVAQINNSFSRDMGTLRGLHFQRGASSEEKLVRVLRGSVFDVVLDLRRDSSSYGRWAAVELTSEKRNMMLVPKGCAHGVLTLEPETELLYVTSAPYDAPSEGGVRWDDPQFRIQWPFTPTTISAKDASWPLWTPGDSVLD